ncbi:MAG: SpoIID/LytB domain-containing protein [Bacteroidota bacterium]
MLKQNHIPKKEPVVSIGIILPEDGVNEIDIEIPESLKEGYSIDGIDKSAELKPGSRINLKLQDGKVQVKINGEDFVIIDEVSVHPDNQKKALAPQEGIKVKNVISGRDYHWKKHIDVYIPDIVKIKVVDDVLFLCNELPLEHYLMCVSTSEMNASCPDAFVEAQTITARSWILAAAEQKHKDLGLDACNDDCCQRYQGTTHLSQQSILGSLTTSGIVAIYDDQICDARYSKSCGGMMETFDSIWEEEEHAYLKNIPDSATQPEELTGSLTEEENFEHWVNTTPKTYCSSAILNEQELKQYLGTVDEKGEYFRWERYVSQEDLTENINKHHNISAKAVLELNVKKRGGGGRVIYLDVIYLDESDNKKQLTLNKDFSIRQSLDKSFLYSSAFIVESEKGDSEAPAGFMFKGAGWGHGVGFCQIGALSMALQGNSSEKIMTHYFPGAELKTIY